MSKKFLFPLTAFFFILGSLVGTSLSKASDPGPETMTLKSITGKKPARFSHKKHQEFLICDECHHAETANGVKSLDIEGMRVKKCAFCHNSNDMTNLKLNSFKLAAHGLCKECHKQNRDSAPTKCSGCHIK